jgi:hypothetical protein
MENSVKIMTLASFVNEEKVESFIKYLNKRFNLSPEKIFIYTSPEEKDKKILTFRIYLREGKKINTKTFFPTTIIVHKKGECFYTINALNKLIDRELGDNKGNTNYKDYEIDWDKYQDNILIVKNNELTIMDIKRNFS